jgi:glycosyltransferase involved in cell wall biosynthesis
MTSMRLTDRTPTEASELRSVAARLSRYLGPERQVVVVTADEAERADATPEHAVVVLEGAPLRRLRELASARGLQAVYAGLLRADGDPANRRRSPVVIAVAPEEEGEVGALLAAGPHGLALDPEVGGPAAPTRTARVCVASYEVVGPTMNGGIGTANTSLAQALARAGHDVTLLFTGREDVDGERWRAHYAEQGIAFDVLPAGQVGSPHANLRRSWELFEWLAARDREEPFDVIHFPDCQGHGYIPALAKRHGIAFTRTLLVAGVHSSTRWVFEANREPMRWIESIVDEHLERESVAHADVMVSPSMYLVDYMRARGWRIPERWFVQQYVLPPSAAAAREAASTAPAGAPRELVFFGRLEVRKGLEAFCDALDWLAADDTMPAFELTFMGKTEHILSEPAEEYVSRRARDWPWKWRIVTDLGQPEAVAHLASGRCVAVMPSTVDNSPNTVIEALSLGIPFIASSAGGTGELIHAEDVERVTFDGWGTDPGVQPPAHADTASRFDGRPLADRIRDALSAPAAATRFAVDPHATEAAHVSWHAAIAASPPEPERAADASVSVCVVHRDEPQGLRATLAGIEALDPQPEAVVLIDEGSSTRDGLAALESAEGLAAARRWRVIRGPRSRAGQLRNDALAGTDADVIAILRAGDVPAGDLISRLAVAASGSDAGAFSFPVRSRTGEDDAPDLLVPIGGPAPLGLVYPAFSAGPFAVRRSAFDALGGYAADGREDEVDHDLLNRLLLAGGGIEVVPAPLAEVTVRDRWSETREQKLTDSVRWTYDSDQDLRVQRAFAALLPGPVQDLPAQLRGLHDRTMDVWGQMYLQAEHLDLQHKRLQELEAHIASLEGRLRNTSARRALRLVRRQVGAIRAQMRDRRRR